MPDQKPLKPSPPRKDDIELKRGNPFQSPAFFVFILMVPVLAAIAQAVMVPEEPAPPAAQPAAEPEKPHGPYQRRIHARPEPENACHFDDLVGQRATVDIRDELQAKGRVLRVLSPDAKMTMDFNPKRVNIEVGPDGIILKVWCG